MRTQGKRTTKTASLKRIYIKRGLLSAIFMLAAVSLVVSFFLLKDDKQDGQPQKVAPVKIKKAPVTPGQVVSDVPYCGEMKLDIYQPREVRYEKTPVVIFMHGGAWEVNNKTSEPAQLDMVEGLRDEGFAIVSIDYRKMPTFYYPAPIEDALCSVRFLRAQAKKYYFDTGKFAIYGFSAGGHLAAMTGTVDAKSQFNNGQYADQSSRVQAVVTLAGLLDFEEGLYPRNPPRISMFLNGRPIEGSYPAAHASQDDPPFLLIHGDKDQNVPVTQSKVFAEELEEKGADSEILVVQNAEHGLGQVDGIMQPDRDEVKERIHAFIKKELRVR